MLVECSNCGIRLLTEADLIVFQNRPHEKYYSCGCVENNKAVLDYIKRKVENK